MSHELRTPLNAVLGFSEAIQHEIFGPLGSSRYKEYLGNIHNSGSHLLSLINDILDIARYDAGRGELQEDTFDPLKQIADTIKMMTAQAAKAKVALLGDIEPDVPCLKGDQRRMRQVLLNLLSNALKFTPSGGKVTVRAFRSERGFVLQVIDTGIGIAHSDFHKALEPFGQVDSSLARKYDGIGLGLPLTRQMVELHGGSLDLDSLVGRGTTVTITLPAWRLVSRADAAA
jgi:signal transduction histidine kinase